MAEWPELAEQNTSFRKSGKREVWRKKKEKEMDPQKSESVQQQDVAATFWRWEVIFPIFLCCLLS